MYTYRVKTKFDGPDGIVHTIDIFRTAREVISFLENDWKEMFCKADYRTIYRMRPSEFLSVRQGVKCVTILLVVDVIALFWHATNHAADLWRDDGYDDDVDCEDDDPWEVWD